MRSGEAQAGLLCLTLDLLLDGGEDGAHTGDGGLHGGHLRLHQRLLVSGAGHRRRGDLLGVGRDLLALRVLVGDFHD